MNIVFVCLNACMKSSGIIWTFFLLISNRFWSYLWPTWACSRTCCRGEGWSSCWRRTGPTGTSGSAGLQPGPPLCLHSACAQLLSETRAPTLSSSYLKTIRNNLLVYPSTCLYVYLSTCRFSFLPVFVSLSAVQRQYLSVGFVLFVCPSIHHVHSF